MTLLAKYEEQVQAFVDVCHRLAANMYVTGYGGNLAWKLEDDLLLITPTQMNKGEVGPTDVVFINHGRNVLDIETSALEERFSKLIVEPSAADAARRLAPLCELQTLQGVEFIFDGVPRAQLQEMGVVHTPNLAELFVAVVGGQQ